MTNEQIATVFDEMADLLEISGENAFRIRAYRNGARAIRDLGESVSTILKDPTRSLTDIEGIGETLAEKSKVLVDTGGLPALDKLREKVPPTLIDVMRVPGLGAKKAAALFHKLGVVDLPTLKRACEEKKIETLEGFGVKTQESILKGLAIAEQGSQRMLISEADDVVSRLRNHFAQCEAVKQIDFAGSYRRGRETVGDIDTLVISDDHQAVMDQFERFPARTETIARGDTKMSIRIERGFQVDLRVVPAESWGAALLYFTGSKEHNVRLRTIAKRHGLLVNEYGIYDTKHEDRWVAGKSEEDMYAALDMPWIPPELREGRIELDGLTAKDLPKLIEVKDIRGDLHMHTTASDGVASIAEMAQAAMQRGLEYIAITDHSKRVSMARGLDAERLLAQWSEIDAYNETLDGKFHVLKGIECDILESGEMDLPPETLAQADWVLASVHYGQKQSRQQITDRILNAIRHPSVTAIAHPTGRLLGRRDAYEVDLDAVIQAAAEYGKILELNSNPLRLDLNEAHCAAAKNAGVMIVINTDSHDPGSLSQIRFGITQAKRAGLEAKHVLNTLSYKRLLTKLKKIKK
jgi:DNA polymerase (family X)